MRAAPVVPASYRSAPLPSALAFDANAIRVERREVGADSHYLREDLRLPSAGENGQPGNALTARFDRSRLPGKRPLVVVLPIWGSYSYPPRVAAARIRHRSAGRMSVLWVEGASDTLDFPALLGAPDEATFLGRAAQVAARERALAVDIRRLLRWAVGQPEVDPQRVAVVGFSRSAMTAAVVAAHEPRLRALVLVMGGAHPGEAIAFCPGDGTGDVQRMVERRFGWSRQKLAAKLEPLFRTMDPVSYAGRVDPSRVLLFQAGADRCLPADARQSLWEVLGRPERIVFPWSHKVSFLSMTPLGLDWTRGEIYRFLARHLLGGQPAVSGVAPAAGR